MTSGRFAQRPVFLCYSIHKNKQVTNPMPINSIRTGNFIRPDAVLKDVGIREGMKVVHLGCGPGYYVIPAAKFVGPSGRAVGIDIREQALETLRHKAKMEGLDNVDAIRGDLEQVEGSHLPNNWADLVVMVNILHQSDPRKVMAEAVRILRPEVGRLLTIEWEVTNVPMGPPVEDRITPDTILGAAKSNNLVMLRRFKPSSYHFSFLFARAVA